MHNNGLISPGVAVPRTDGEKFLKYAASTGILDRRKRIFSDQDRVYFPVFPDSTPSGYAISMYDFEKRENITIKEFLVEKYGKEVESIKWQRVGGTLIFGEESKISKEMSKDIVSMGYAECVMKREGSVEGSERSPGLIVLYGEPSDTTYRENGINFVLNPQRVMISKGNIMERGIPFADLLSGDRILDMFCGIGYFSLPLAKKINASKLDCSDINPVALEYLMKSYNASGLDTHLEVFNMDCRLVPKEKKYDIILMGNFKSLNYLPAALSHIENKGQLILHYLVATGTEKQFEKMITGTCSGLSFHSRILYSHRVKSYAPHLWHISTLIEVSRF
ncbi:MAG: class I SAM-dependent methyltransferase [Cuniculiplasma sp.]